MTSQQLWLSTHLVERYSADFDPVSTTGDVEIWIPIKEEVKNRLAVGG